MGIPHVCGEVRTWWEQLGTHKVVLRVVSGRKIAFIVENTRKDHIHACTVEDICCLLEFVPRQDWEALDTFVLRQSTKKQRVLAPTWGRLAYSADLGQRGRKTIRLGPTVFLEAVAPAIPWRWAKSMDPADSQELERLKQDGHHIEDRTKYYQISITMESARLTQLYRTLLHEIGHWVDWLANVERPSLARKDSFDLLADRYFSRPSQERESFAHRYADELRTNLVLKRLIPFPRRINAQNLRRDGLELSDFLL